MQARYGIMNVMLQAGQGFLEIKPCVIEDKKCLEIHLDRSKIRSVGAPAVSEFLTKLQIYKATADDVEGTKLYLEATSVPDDWLTLRDTVINSKQPRKCFVQGNTFISNDDVYLKEYDASTLGMIQSYVERRV